MADKKEYKPTYGFSSYFDPSEINQAIYGDSVGNFLNNLNQGLTTFMGAVEGRQNAQRQMAFQANQNQLDRDFQAEQNQLDRQFKVDQQQREYNQKIGLMNHQSELDMKTIVMEADMKKAQQDRANAYKAWGDHVTMLYEDLSKRLAEDSSTNAKGLYEELDRAIQSGFDQAKAYGFKDQTEYNNWINDNWNPSKMSFKDGLEQQGRLISDQRAKNNFKGEVNTLVEESDSITSFLDGVMKAQTNYSLPIDYMADEVIIGLDTFFKRKGVTDSASAMKEDGYMSREDYVNKKVKEAEEDLKIIAEFLDKNNITLNQYDVSRYGSLMNEENVRAMAEKNYSDAHADVVAKASQKFTDMQAELGNIDGVINELAVQKDMDYIDSEGNKNPNISHYEVLTYDQNLGQYIFKHNYEYVTGKVLGNDITKDTVMQYLYDIEGVFGNKSETISLDGKKTVVSDSKYSEASPYDSYDSGLVIEDGVYTKYTSSNFENARNLLIAKGKYENKEDIPNDILIATTMIMDDALNTVTEESKMALWNYYTSPYRKEEEVYAGMQMMSSLGLFPESNGTTVYDREHALQKWKEVPVQIKSFMDETWFKEDLNNAISSFSDIPNSNAEKFKYMFEQEFIDRAKDLFQSGKGTDKDLMDLQENLLKNMTETYSNGIKVSNDSEKILEDIENLIEGNNREYQSISSIGALQDEIIRTSSGLSPYKWGEVTSMATMIAGGHPESVYQYLADKLNGDMGLTGDSAIVIEDSKDLSNLIKNGSVSGKDKDKNIGISRQASYYMNELSMAWAIGAPTEQMIDTFIGDSGTPFLQFYTEEGKTGIFIPSQNGIPAHMFISENMSAGGAYSAYSQIPSVLEKELTGRIGKHETSTLSSTDFLSCGTKSVVKNDIGPIQIETNLNKPTNVGFDPTVYDVDMSQEQARVTEQQKEYNMKKNSLHYRIKMNASYQNFMNTIRRNQNNSLRRTANTVNFGV